MSNKNLKVNISPKFLVLKGMAYGHRQTTMLGEIQVRRGGSNEVDKLNEFLSPLIEQQPLQQESHHTTTDALVANLLYWHTAFQRRCRIPVFDICRSKLKNKNAESEYDSYLVSIPFFSPKASVESLVLLAGIINNIYAQGAPSSSENNKKYYQAEAKFLKKYALKGANTFYLLHAAFEMKIPYQNMMANMYRFGEGENIRWLNSTMSDETASLGISIAHNKMKTAWVLRQTGFPTTQHNIVKNIEQALEVANELGYPVVVKPTDQEQGIGVSAGLKDEASIKEALEEAQKYSHNIMVEKHVEGEDYRLTVIFGQVLNVFKRRAGGVIGDGIHTISELVAIEQKKPKLQRTFIRKGLMLLELDNEALRLLSESNLNVTNIPKRGEYIALRKKKNISSGGSFKAVKLDDIHPDNILLAIRVTKALHLDMAGIDLISPDISCSWLETETAICEVNAQPQIGDTIPIDGYKEIFSSLMKGKHRIPISLMVCISEDTYPEYKQLSQLLDRKQHNGISTRDGIWLDGQKITKKFADGFIAAKALLSTLDVTTALLVMTADELMKYGAPTDRFDNIKFIMVDPDVESKQDKFVGVLDMLKAYSEKITIIKDSSINL